MKTKLLLLAALVIGFTFSIQSCNDDDNHGINNSAVENAFAAKYPSINRVDWEIKGNYYVADFWLNGLECEAWFTWDGDWQLTETDITFDQLPAAVKTAFGQSEFASWRIDDVDMLERKDMEVAYVVEVEQGNQEYDLYYAADGTLIKAVLDTDNDSGSYLPTSLPESISTYISTNYPSAKIIEVEREYGGAYEVDVIDGAAHKKLRFTSAGEWIYTKTEDILQVNVPQNVLTALQNSEYGSYAIDDIDYYETPTESYFLFELELGSAEIDVKVTLDGVVTEIM
ncbi:MAG: PepSY-like domain-containing protein [Prevotellaceae bacterium]|jgi:hypothetical protein|nr:PepSY-like domain-containing protein [Prevotellaceae bacterium]